MPARIKYFVNLGVRFALLVANEIFVPAAALYESRITREVVAAFPPELAAHLFREVGSGENYDEFVSEKLEQYSPQQEQGRIYRNAAHRDFYPWISRTRSSTADLRSDWFQGLNENRYSKIYQALLQFERNPEQILEKVPERLETRAFIVENVLPLLVSLENPHPTLEHLLHGVINPSYFGSYLRQLRCGLIRDIPFLEIDGAEVPPTTEDVYFRSLLAAVDAEGLRSFIETADLIALSELRGQERWCRVLQRYQGEQPPTLAVGTIIDLKPPARNLPDILILHALEKEAAPTDAVLQSARMIAGGKSDPLLYSIGRTPTGVEVIYTTLVRMGPTEAAASITHAIRTIDPSFIIVVGIAGGCPNPKDASQHVRLGDIVCSDEKGGIFEHDNVKVTGATEAVAEYRGETFKPDTRLLQVARALYRRRHTERPWLELIKTITAKLPNCARPSPSKDKLHGGEGAPLA